MKKMLFASLLLVSLRLSAQDSMYGDQNSPRAKPARQVTTPVLPDDAFMKGSRQLSNGLLMVGLGAVVSFFGPLALDNNTKYTQQYLDNTKLVGYIGGGFMVIGAGIGASGAIKLGKAHRQTNP